MCGIFGITNADQASKLAYLGLFALQHRGQESAGLASLFAHDVGTVPEAAAHIYFHRRPGLVSDVFSEEVLVQLQGNCAIGHVRYSTAGGDAEANIQPLTARVAGLPVALVHNGNIVNAAEIRSALEMEGALLQGSADTEIILHLMAKSRKVELTERLLEALNQLTGAFSLLLLTPTHLYAAVDSFGYRPLSLGEIRCATKDSSQKKSFVLASETCAMDLVGAHFIRDVIPGEVLCIELLSGKMQSFALASESAVSVSPAMQVKTATVERANKRSHCVFEQVYFARPDSVIWGQLSYDARFAMGQELARCAPVDADMVIAIPDSGVPMAMGYAHAAHIPYKIGLIRNHYVGRTFIEPTQNVRHFRVRLKLNPVRETIRGKRVVVIDDSIVRGTTSQKIIELLREAGAKEIHLRIASPPVKYPCFYGIDTPHRRDLLAQRVPSIAGMNDFLRSDSLAFLSEAQLLKVVSENNTTLPERFCTACFSGSYQDSFAQKLGCPEKLEGVLQ